MKPVILTIIIVVLLIFSFVYFKLIYPEEEQTVVKEEILPEEPILYPVKTWNFIASNDPDDYLGDYIGYESPSDWKIYPLLVNKVNELTAGLTNNRDKALAIANWVKKSKSYQKGASVANDFGSIIEIFNSDKGVCLDAAYLTTAMLRLAGIPARAVAPERGIMHEYTEAFIDGNWYPIDATFGLGQAYFPAVLEPNPHLRYIHDYSGYYDKDDAYIFLVKTVTKEGYGTVQYPTVSEKELDDWFEEWSKEEEVYQHVCITEPKFYCVLHIEEDGKWVGIWSPGFYEKGPHPPRPPPAPREGCEEYKDRIKNFVSKDSKHLNYRDRSVEFEDVGGWIHAALPEGNYKINCSIGNVFDQKPPYNTPPHQTAYAEFLINFNIKTTITSEMFRKIEGVDQKEFEALVGLMKLD